MDLSRLRFKPETHEYSWDETPVPSVTQVIDYFSLMDTRFYPEWVKDRGRAVHLACEYDDDGSLDESSLDPRIMGRVRGYRKFEAEIEHAWEMTETRLYHPVYRFAGTLDRAGFMYINGKLCQVVLDLKSGANLPCYWLQLAGYVLLVTIIHKEKNPLNWHRVVLQLNDDGTYKPHVLPQETLMSDIAAFVGYVNAMHWEIANNMNRKERVV